MVKHLPANAGDLGLIPGLGRSLEKETATHSSTLAWKIPWTEEAGRLQSMGLQKVRCDAAPLASIRQMSRQGSRGSPGEYQADEQAGVARLRWRVSGR